MKTMAFLRSKIPTTLILMISLGVSAAGQMGNLSGSAPNPAESSPAPESGPAALPLPAFAALGSSFAQSNKLGDLGWSEDQIGAFVAGVNAALHGKAFAMDDTARQVSAEMGRRLHEVEAHRQQQAAEEFAQPGRLEKYMKEMRKRHAMELSDSGLLYNIQPGRSSIRPRPGDTIVVSCSATAADGITKLPQLSNDHMRIKLENMLPGFMEGFQMMTLESQAKFILPPALSFGNGEWPQGVSRGTPLLFMVTLHEVVSADTTAAVSP